MTVEGGTIELTVKANWVNACILWPLARPYARIDGAECQCRWGVSHRLTVSPGRHQLQAYLKYRGTSAILGRASTTVDVAKGDHWRLLARNGWMNHQPFAFVASHVERADA